MTNNKHNDYRKKHFLVLGLVNLKIYPTLIGAILIILGKLWVIDRMVWLYEEMKDNNPEYRSWLY